MMLTEMPNTLEKYTLEGKKKIASSINGVAKLESSGRRMQLSPYFTLDKNQLQMDPTLTKNLIL